MTGLTPTVELNNVTMSFDGIKVLKGVDLKILPGEIHGLAGENGSGKSTLVKVLGGIYTPDRGSQVLMRGQKVSLPVRNAQRNGLSIIHQNLALVESMSVADNIGISVGYDRPIGGRISGRRENKLVRRLAEKFGLSLDPERLVGELSPAEQSVVAILRALRQLGDGDEGNVIVLDEPTAALPRAESIRLLEMLRTMAENGTAVLYISHRMHEMLNICDRISVLRSGKMVATRNAAESSESEIVELMLGYELGEFYPTKHISANQDVRLEVKGLTHGPVHDVSFSAHRGEIVGVTGLAGMGQDAIPYLIAGGASKHDGQIMVDGKVVDGSPKSGHDAGLALVPGNRQRDALWLGGTASENLTLPFLSQLCSKARINSRRELEFTTAKMRQYSVSPSLPKLSIDKFSGGNQQKIVVARTLHRNPGVILLHEPTQGVDAGAKKEILNLVRQAADGGAAVVVFSSDSEEMSQLCHRVYVMRYGTIAASLESGEVSENRILSLSQRVPVSDSSLPSDTGVESLPEPVKP